MDQPFFVTEVTSVKTFEHSAVKWAEPWQRELDSESGCERSFRERPLAARFLAGSGASRQLGELIPEDHNSVSRVRSGHAAASLLSKECADAEHDMVAAAVASHARGVGRSPVVAAARGGRLQVTPYSAQQRGVLPNCQCQYDRKNCCSEHA